MNILRNTLPTYLSSAVLTIATCHRCAMLGLFALGISLFPKSVHGQLVLDGGGLLLVEEGPAATSGGDPAPANLATDAIPFATSELGPELGLDYHFIDNLNDGFYGNEFSWIGGDDDPFFETFAGIDLGGSPIANVQSIAFGRSNVLSGDNGCGGAVCLDRHMGAYILQYTQVPNPSNDLDFDTTGNPVTGWADIGLLDYGASDGVGTNYNNTWQRHRYNFDPVDATGIRLLVPGTGLGGGTAIDEIEIYDMAGEFVPPPAPPSPISINAAEGFSIDWDGNDGDFFDSEPPPDGARVPDNAALASNGAVAFTSSDLGPELNIEFHVAENINDGFYGNANSWIGGTDNPFAPEAFAGVALDGEQFVTSIAWGRDNGNDISDACDGQCTDRSFGNYVLQYTQSNDPNPDTTTTGDASTGWQTIGEIAYTLRDEDFTEYLRHEFKISDGTGGVQATGIRLIVPNTGLAGGTAIDELEVYAGVAQLLCDVNTDGACDVNDINDLARAIAAGQTEQQFDLNRDGSVDLEDHRHWVVDLMNTWFGDANLDGEFNSTDFVVVFQARTFEAGGEAGWAEGDWNGDGTFTSSDFVTAFVDAGYEQGPRPIVANVPEPTGAAGMLFCIMILSFARKWLP